MGSCERLFFGCGVIVDPQLCSALVGAYNVVLGPALSKAAGVLLTCTAHIVLPALLLEMKSDYLCLSCSCRTRYSSVLNAELCTTITPPV